MAILVALDQHFHQITLKTKKETHHLPRLVLQRGVAVFSCHQNFARWLWDLYVEVFRVERRSQSCWRRDSLSHLEISRPSLSQLLEVVSKKPARHKYVEIPDEPVDPRQLKMAMIKVNKETETSYLSSL